MKEAIFVPIIMLATRQIVSPGNPGTGKSDVFLPQSQSQKQFQIIELEVKIESSYLLKIILVFIWTPGFPLLCILFLLHYHFPFFFWFCFPPIFHFIICYLSECCLNIVYLHKKSFSFAHARSILLFCEEPNASE